MNFSFRKMRNRKLLFIKTGMKLYFPKDYCMKTNAAGGFKYFPEKFAGGCVR